MKRVLVADDDRYFVETLSEALRNEGYCAEALNDGRDLLRALSQGEYDALLVEPCLPRSSWYTLLDGVRRREPKLALVVITAFPSTALSSLCRRLDAGVLTKPVEPRRILDVLRGELPDHDELPRRSRTLAGVEWEFINETILESAGNLAEAARRLGIPRQTLYRKLRKHPVLDW
jgi:two-component system, response regulator RegA